MAENSNPTKVLGVRTVRVPPAGGARYDEPVLRLGGFDLFGRREFVPGETAVAACNPLKIYGAAASAEGASPLTRSVHRNTYLKQLRQRAKTEEHTAPTEWCECGIYAYNLLENSKTSNAPARMVVVGWGEVLHGEKYWRAQYVKPVSLFPVRLLGFNKEFPVLGESAKKTNRDRMRWWEGIAERYDLPILDELNFFEYVEQFGEWSLESRWYR